MNKELYHHGILGQHWGIRRYQNKDGSLTDKGKKRYDNIHEKAMNAKSIREINKYKKYLSDDELEQKTARFKNEQFLYEQSGQKAVNDAMISVGKVALKTAVAAGAIYVGKKYLSDHKEEIQKYIVNTIKDATISTAENTANTVRNVARNVGQTTVNAGHNVRSNISKSDIARQYVRTIDSITGGAFRRR